MKLLVHASGYRTVPPFANARQEIMRAQHPRCGGNPKHHWSAASVDFAAAGKASGGSSPAASIAELLNVIRQQALESIEELRIIAHGNEENFVLAGEVRPDDEYFTKDDALIGPSDAFKAAMPQFRDLQDRFTADARIVLAGCNAGSGNEEVMSIASHAFLRPVFGFKEEIQHKFIWGPAGPAVRDHGKVVCFQVAPNSRVLVRAKMCYSPAAQQQAEMLQEEIPDALFKTNVWELEPDASSNVGDIFMPMRSQDAVFGSGELVWRILQEFYPNHAAVSGTGWYGVDPHLSGLKVRKKGDGMFIDAGPDFSRKTTPRTLRNRVAEVGKALGLIQAKSQGTVPMT
jgi:hypothetical protein